MSRENVEVVREVLSGLSRDAAQEPTIKSFVERLSPDLEFVEDPRFPEGGTYHGREEYLRYARDFVAQFEHFTFTVEDLRAIPDGRVLVCLRLRGRGKGSKAEFDIRAGWVYTVREGRVVHIRAYMDRTEALEAVGLPEQGIPQGNVDVVRRWNEAFNRRDLEGLLAVTHPSFEFRTSGAFPDLDPVYEAHAGFRRFYEDFTATWESFTVSTHELREVAPRALLLGMFEGRGRDGVQVRRQTASVWTFREGLVLGIQNYAGWWQALEAVGLRE